MFVILRENENRDRIEAAAGTIYRLDSRRGGLVVLKAPSIGPLFLPLPAEYQRIFEKLADESPLEQDDLLAASAE